ncbi:MAG: acyloxyacyl hydrolase [Fimbriimonadaceae bacterium]|nr:acyloxyacyl hydrolase [Fimbriimonadaceae bacterium]
MKPEPVFKYRGRQPHLHQEVFFLFTRGGGLNGLPVDNLNTVGYSFGSRLPVPWFGSSASAFVDLGWGFSFSSDTTVDLDSQINSTPYFGVGFDLGGSASHSFLVIRWFHMSNAGLRGENQGMNAVQLLFGLRL